MIELREEMFNDTRFGAEVFYMHLRGVDTVFFFTYLHILKKTVCLFVEGHYLLINTA